MIDAGLRGKVALVTGANHGIGAATAKAFAAEGATVFVNYLRRSMEESIDKAKMDVPGEALYRFGQSQSAEQVVQDIRSCGGRAEAWEADLADPVNIAMEIMDGF